MKDVADHLFSLLKSYGVDYIFGIPGDELKIFDALAHSDIEFITTRHEQAAAFMAQAVGKLSPIPGFCISTLGPGATNLVTAVADAHQNRSPLIVLSGQLEMRYHNTNPRAHQYIDLQKLFAPITKDTFIIKSDKDLKPILERAIKTATTNRKGPVHITLPVDIMEKKMTYVRSISNLKIKTSKISINPKATIKAAELIKKSKFPVLFFGQQAQYLTDDVKKLIEKTKIPVMTSFLGKGSFDETNSLSLGTVSRHIKDKLKEVLENADLFIVVGYDYIEGVQPYIFGNKPLVYIDTVSQKQDGLIKSSMDLIGDIQKNTQALFLNLNETSYRSDWNILSIREVKKGRYQQVLESQQIKSNPPNPFYVMQAIQRALSGDEHIVSDVGNHKQAIGLGLKAKKPLRVHFSNGLSSMGFALPFAAGIRFAKEENKKIIAICGDGGFLMNVQELETIKRYNLNIKIIVFVDNAFGMIKSNLLAKYQRVKNLDFTNPDFQLLAKSFGIDYIAVSGKKDIFPKLTKLMQAKETTLLTIPIKYS